MRIWITGGAGYVGSTIARACLAAGYRPLIIDDLSRGSRHAIAELPLYRCDFADTDMLRQAADRHGRPDLVIHAAALVSAVASVREPFSYYQTNVFKTLSLCQFLIELGCPNLVVESSAAVYGDTSAASVDEQAPLRPASPYAYSKAAMERMLRDVGGAHPLRIVCFRLFNVVGAAHHEPGSAISSGVLCSLRTAAADGAEFAIYGHDWPTPDGTPLRDFVDVRDVAGAHLAIIEQAARRRPAGAFEVFNIATGTGTTVRQLVRLAESIQPAAVRVLARGRRPGDIAGFVGDSTLAHRELGWQPTRSLSEALLSERSATTGTGRQPQLAYRELKGVPACND